VHFAFSAQVRNAFVRTSGTTSVQLLALLLIRVIVLELLASRATTDISLGQIDEILRAKTAFRFRARCQSASVATLRTSWEHPAACPGPGSADLPQPGAARCLFAGQRDRIAVLRTFRRAYNPGPVEDEVLTISCSFETVQAF
jgi:hypothetical protein